MGVNIEMNFVDLNVYLDLVAERLGWDKAQVEQHCRRFGPVFHTEDNKRRVLVLLNDEYHEDYSPYYNLSSYLCHIFGVSKDDKIGEGEETYGDFLFGLVLNPAGGKRHYERGPLLIGASLDLFDRTTEPDPGDFQDDEESDEE